MKDDDYRPMVRIARISNIKEHGNADRLEIASVFGWNVVVQKDIYKVGDLILYFEIDSVLPEEIENRIFGKDAKIKLHKSRVKITKIRQVYSEGLVTPVSLFYDKLDGSKIKEDLDVTELLGVKKYEEPIRDEYKAKFASQYQSRKIDENPNFKKVRKPSNVKYFQNVFGKSVVITEKIHGTSFVAGKVKKPNETLWDKIDNFLFGEYEFCYRSMNVQQQRREKFWMKILVKLGFRKKGNFYENQIQKNVYTEAVLKYNLMNIIPDGYELTGEIYGSGIQKGYSYGCEEGERKLVVFGVRKDGENISPNIAHHFVRSIGIDYVPVLFVGTLTSEILQDCTVGASYLHPETKVREGCVIEVVDEKFTPNILKSINPEYLMGDNTDFH